ncbi:MAG: HEAT repeat domain-containing protein [Cyanobacteria bacterium J06626_18]
MVIGAAIIYFLLSRQVAEQGAAMQVLRQQLTQADAERDRRIKAATESLQRSHAAELAQAQAVTEGVQQQLIATKAERDRLKYDYDANVRAVHAGAARQMQQKVAEAKADYKQRLQAERVLLQEEYEARLAAAQPYTAQSATAQPAAPLMPTVPNVLDASDSATVPLIERTETPAVAGPPIPEEPAAPPPTPTIPPVPAPPEPDVTEPDVSEAASAEAAEVALPPHPQTVTSVTPEPTPTVRQVPAIPAAAANQSITARPVSALTQNASALLVDSYAPEVKVRCQVANAIAAAMPTASATDQARWLPTLKRLARDGDPAVRVQAIQALSHTKKASQSLPLLRRALRDADPAVIEAASTAMSRFKGYTPQPHPKAAKSRLPKNR